MITNNSVLVARVKSKIKELMEINNMSVYELAQKSDLTEACIRNWYTSRNYTPSLEAIEKICSALDMPVFELFCNDEEKMPVSEDNKEILKKLQLLTPKQRRAIIAHIEGYLDL